MYLGLFKGIIGCSELFWNPGLSSGLKCGRSVILSAVDVMERTRGTKESVVLRPNCKRNGKPLYTKRNGNSIMGVYDTCCKIRPNKYNKRTSNFLDKAPDYTRWSTE